MQILCFWQVSLIIFVLTKTSIVGLLVSYECSLYDFDVCVLCALLFGASFNKLFLAYQKFLAMELTSEFLYSG